MSDEERTRGLLGTTDAMVWAEEFVRIFKGWTIVPTAKATVPGIPTPHGIVDEGTMVGWFANALEVGKARGSEMARREIADQHRGEVDESFEPQPICTCPRFSDTGGYRIADLTCPIHGTKGTDPGDGYWQPDQGGDGL